MPSVRCRTSSRGGTISRRGFSLVELIVVIVLIAIIGVTATAAMSSAPQTRQRAGARILVRDLMYARERSVALAAPTWVRVNLDSETVDYLSGATWGAAVAMTETGSGLPLRTRLHTTSEGSALVNVLLGTVNGSSTTPYVLGFDWLGRPTNSAGALLTSNVAITVTTSGFSTATVTIQANSGAVTYALP